MKTKFKNPKNNTDIPVLKTAWMILSAMVLLYLAGNNLFAQGTGGVSILEGTDAPHESAMLEVKSTNKGVLIPRLHFDMIDGNGGNGEVGPLSGADGLMVFIYDGPNGDERGFWYYDETENVWKKLGVGDRLWQKSLSSSSIYREHGGVGIGIFDPNFALDVDGSIAVNASNLAVFPKTTIPSIHFKYTGFPIGPSIVTFDEKISLDISGDGIKSQPFPFFDLSTRLVVNGSISQSSDISLKTNINTLTNSLDSVLSLRAVSFNWIDTTKGTDLQVGVIAQELETVFPSLVTTLPNGLKVVNYANLVAPLIGATKEQQQTIDSHSSILTPNGVQPPSLTTVDRDNIQNPQVGLMIFNTTVNKHQGYDGSTWHDLY